MGVVKDLERVGKGTKVCRGTQEGEPNVGPTAGPSEPMMLRTLPLLFALCLPVGLSACDDDAPVDPQTDETDTDSEEGLPTEVTITLTAEGSPTPNDVLVASGGDVTFDNSGSQMEAMIDFSSELPSTPSDFTLAAGDTLTFSVEGDHEWSYRNVSAGAGVPASGTIDVEYDD